MFQTVATKNPNLLRGMHLARDAVLFTLTGQSVVLYYPALDYSLWFLVMLGLDIFGLVLLWVPREIVQILGYVWAGLMSIVLMNFTLNFLGSTFLSSGVIMILLLSSIEFLAVLKVAYDQFILVSTEDETN